MGNAPELGTVQGSDVGQSRVFLGGGRNNGGLDIIKKVERSIVARDAMSCNLTYVCNFSYCISSTYLWPRLTPYALDHLNMRCFITCYMVKITNYLWCVMVSYYTITERSKQKTTVKSSRGRY